MLKRPDFFGNRSWPVATWVEDFQPVAKLHRLRSVHFETQGYQVTWGEQEKSLQFVYGNNAPWTSWKGFYRSLHTSKGKCNHAVAFPMCGLEWFPWWLWLFWCLTAQRIVPIEGTWIEVAFDLPKKSTSWQRIWVSPRYGSAIQLCGVLRNLCFSDCWFNISWPVAYLSRSRPGTIEW